MVSSYANIRFSRFLGAGFGKGWEGWSGVWQMGMEMRGIVESE